MANDLSLLFQLRADNAQAKAVMADTRAAVTSLRTQFGGDLKQMQGVAKSVLADIGENVNAFVGQRIPLIGGAFVRVTSNLRGLNDELKKGGPQTEKLAQQIDGIARASGKSTTEVSRFLTTFVRLQGQTARNEAAFKAFGGSVDLIGNKTANLLPQLEQAGASLAAVSTEAVGTGAAMAGMAGPIAIAVAAIGAQVIAVTTLTKEIFNLTKASAEYQGKLFDLSQQVGVSVETLSALEIEARKTGGSIDGLVASLGIFQRRLEEAFEDEGSKAAVTLRRLGIESTDTETALRQAIAALAQMPEGFRQTATAMELFGRGGKSVLAVAKESQGDIDAVIDRLRGLGLVTTEQAKIADEFNDQLVLLQVQLRGLGTQAIPVVLDVLKDLSATLKENRDLFNILQGIVKAVALSISLPLKAALNAARIEFNKVEPILRVTVLLFERLAQAIGFINANPVKIPSTEGLAGQPAAGAVDQRDPFTEGLKDELAARRQLQAVLNVEFTKRQQQAESNIALAQRELAAGKITREELLQVILVNNHRKAQAEIDALQVTRRIKLLEQAIAKDDLEKRTQLSNEILAIDAQVVAKRAELQRTAADLTAKSRLEEQRDALAHEQARTDLEIKLGQERIALVEQQIAEETIAREKGLDEIERIENAILVRRGQLLKRELELAGVGPGRQAVLDKITALENERTALERQQSERRIALAEAEAQRLTGIALSTAESINAAAQIGDEARIARVRALAALRVQTEEQAERAILRIKLDALAREDELARIRRTAAEEEIKARIKAVQDQRAALTARRDQTPDLAERTALQRQITALINAEIALLTGANVERNRLDQELNNRLRVNSAQRTAITEQGNRDIDEARQKDLENERRYADELEEIRQRTRDIELDAAEEIIRLMRATFARRKDIIRAQRDLDLADEAERHQRATESIKEQQREVDEQIRVLESYLKSLKVGTTEEIEEHERLIESLEKLRLKREELRRQQEAEDERNRTRKRRVTKESKDAEDESDPLGRFKIDIKKIASEIEESIVPLNEILRNSFLQVADAIGQTVANYVLLGQTGPAVMRKILATALATIAAEAAVNAIKELALGFATLFFNPAESAGHFTAAALWGSIAGVSAVAGRAVAGDLFKSKQPAGSSGGSGAGSSGRDARDPIDLTRTKQTIEIIVRGEPGPGFQNAVIRGIVDDVRTNGPMRDVIIKTAGA